MWSAGLLASLGPVAGALLSWHIPDETEWYAEWFLALAVVATLLAGVSAAFTSAWHPLLPWTASIAAGLLILALAQARVWLTALSAGALASLGGMLTWQLTFLALVFATGNLWRRVPRGRLAWFALMPIVILAASFLI